MLDQPHLGHEVGCLDQRVGGVAAGDDGVQPLAPGRQPAQHLAEVVAALKARRPDLHVVVTGRNAKPELIEAADLVTEMRLVKHPFREGVKGQLGVEF